MPASDIQRFQSSTITHYPNFYESWLNLWNKGEDEKKKAKLAIYPEELKWVATAQDYRAALLIAPENGFRTSGTISTIAEIPVGYHTGKHSHGEEAIYIIDGEGYSVINDQQFVWEKGSCIRVPFGATHQHFNTGNVSVSYYSVMAPYLEALALVAKFEQFEKPGKNTDAKTFGVSTSDSGFDKSGRRLILRSKDAKVTYGGEDRNAPRTAFRESMPKEAHEGPGHLSKGVNMMSTRSDFMGEEVEITGLLCLSPGTAGGKHAHMEALLYVLQGEGYTTVNDEKVPWRPGTAFHIPGPQTPHQHFNTGSTESQFIRAHSAIRYKLFQPAAKEKFPYLYLAHRPTES